LFVQLLRPRRRLLLCLLTGLLFVPAAFRPQGAPAAQAYEYGAPSGGEVVISMKDHQFKPAAIRIAPGTTVVWKNDGRSDHAVAADDGGWDSGPLKRGETFRLRFDHPGRYMYFCAPHGEAGGHGMAGLILVGDVPDAAPAAPPQVYREGPPRTIRVPEDASPIQAAVNRAAPGDLVLIAPGIYHESVVVLTPGITIRGLERNTVILDGESKRDNGIKVLAADNVVIENMTARHYTTNGFYWTGVRGYRGSYLTAYNNGDYGLYAFDSVFGQFDNSYGSGHPDSAFYVGQCQPCYALLTDLVAENNALGYSGTNAGGHLVIMNSLFRRNMSGVVPNTLDSQRLAPQAGTRIVGNRIFDNNNLAVPFHRLQYPSIGTGVLITGGNDNLVEGNLIEDHSNYGIVVLPNLDRKFWIAGGNVVRNNTVRGSGRADLGLGAPAAPGNCFDGNLAGTAHPPAFQWWAYGCGLRWPGGGELSVTLNLLALFLKAEFGSIPQNDYLTQPEPPPQPTLVDPYRPPEPAWPTRQWAAIPPPAEAPTEPERIALFSSFHLMGVALVGLWWSIFFGMYLYALPFILYGAWVTIALWDIIRREDLKNEWRMGWMAWVLLVPLLGPVGYYFRSKSPIPAPVRWWLVLGGGLAYLLLAVAVLLTGL
jgi:plastocyanin